MNAGFLRRPTRRRLARLLGALLGGVAAAGCRRAGDAAQSDPGPRVVSLAPSLTEIVCALGGEAMLVGRSSACNYPPQVVARVPVVGDFGQPSLERLLAVRPTAVLEVDLADETLGRQIERLGIRRVRLPCRRLADIAPAIREVGRVLDRAEPADRLAAQLEGELARWRAAAGVGPRPTVFVEIWNDPLTTAGRSSFISELVTLAGGRNLGDEADQDYFQVSAEWVVARDPQIIVCLNMASAGEARRQVPARSSWEGVAAVRAGRVYAGLDNDRLLRPGPRVLEGLRELRALIAAEPPAP